MKMNTIKLALCALAAISGSIAFGSGIDIQQSPTNFFVPNDAVKYDSPYYRGYNGDWSWTHGAISTVGATTANLNISAFDVDFTSGERDIVYAWDTDTATYISLGYLAGGDDVWAFTNFSLNLSTFGNEISTGLQIYMNVDASVDGWFVTLAKSVLTVDSNQLPPPTPGSNVPDSASSLLLCVTGLAAIGLFRRKLA